MSWIGPITFYAHYEADGDPEWEIEQGMAAGLTSEQAEAFACTNPLYEVAFNFYVNTETGKYICMRVNLGDGTGPFERSLGMEEVVGSDIYRWPS